MAFRTCSEDALLLGSMPNTSSMWTNYTECFPHDVKAMLGKVSGDENTEQKFEIARNTRIMEIIGFSVSLAALLMAIFIFNHFRSLRNNRTKIHKNLFSAMVLQVVVRLTLYADQEFVRNQHDQSNTLIFGIENMPYVCEATYVLLEYSISAMFMWMFIEGLYLYNLVSSNSLRDQGSTNLYKCFGWGIPFMLTAVWATVTTSNYRTKEMKTKTMFDYYWSKQLQLVRHYREDIRCWYGYNSEKAFWIMHTPRLTVIIINIAVLTSILKIVVTKTNKKNNNEMARLRKAVRAMCFLLPLLGITNGLDMFEPSLSGSAFQFACWSYASHFLRSFQGFFITLFYCFLNGEVQNVIKKYFTNRQAIRETRRRQRALFRGYGSHTPPAWNRVTFGAHGRDRRSTGIDTDTGSRFPRRASPHATIASTVATIEHARPFRECRSIGIDTYTGSRILRHASPHGNLARTVANIEHARFFQDRRSTRIDTDTGSRIPQRASPHATLARTVGNIEHARPFQMHEFPYRMTDARMSRDRVDHDFYEADTSV